MPKSNRDKRKHRAAKNPPAFLILAGLALLLVAVFFFKNGTPATASDSSLEAQLDAALAAKRPTFVFLHSLDCIPCKEMMGIVANVYPEFQGSVALIDVDVYDQRNENILRREGLQSIPTLVFYNGNGERQIHIGVMQADQFRQVLSQLAQ